MRKRAIHAFNAVSVAEVERPDDIRAAPWLHLLGPVVYAARTRDGLIKIGWTSDLFNRCQAFGGPSSILGWIPGCYDDEQVIHASLQGLAARGREYYPAHADVLSTVNAMRSELGLGPIAA